MNDTISYISDTVVYLISEVPLFHANICHFGVRRGGCWLVPKGSQIFSEMVKMDSEVSLLDVYKHIGVV
jgi:hypothetical protein